MQHVVLCKNTGFVVILLTLFNHLIPNARADSLTLEQFDSIEGKWRYSLNTIYANSEATGVTIGDDILVQTGPGTFVSIPSDVSSDRVNSDVLVIVPSVRYGLSEKLDISWRASFSYSNIRTENNSGEQSSQTFSRFADSWLGLDYRLVDDRKQLNWTIFGDVAVAENTKTTGNEPVYGRAFVLGLSLYRVYDPIVISMVTAYQLNLSRMDGTNNIDPGDIFTISPSLSFAPNRDSNIDLGFSWTTRAGNEVNGNNTSIRNTSTRTNMSFGYAWSDSLIIFTKVSANISSGNDANISLSLVYEPR